MKYDPGYDNETLAAKLEWCAEKLPNLSGHLIENAREPYEKWAAGFCTDVEGFCRLAAVALREISEDES